MAGKLCYGCMEHMEADETVCKRCGFREEDYVVEPHHLRPGTLLRERYMVGRVLGEGGFGITYVGRDTLLDMKVAIKEFYMTGYVNRNNTYSTVVRASVGTHADTFEKNREKFLKEARVLARFSNEDGIVGIRDFFEENNTAYIVMKFLEGGTLKSHLDQVKRMDWQEVLKVMDPILLSLEHVHREHVIHRDISPDNIMITGEDPFKVVLVDFGAAREVSDTDIKSLSVILKPGYAPEEQYRSKGRQGPWTDIYALCATMYRCITGIVPDESMQRMFEDRLEPPCNLVPGFSPAISNVIMKGMAVRQNNRYQSIEELRNDLRLAQAHPEDTSIANMRTNEEGATVYADPSYDDKHFGEKHSDDKHSDNKPADDRSADEKTVPDSDRTVYAGSTDTPQPDPKTDVADDWKNEKKGHLEVSSDKTDDQGEKTLPLEDLKSEIQEDLRTKTAPTEDETRKKAEAADNEARKKAEVADNETHKKAKPADDASQKKAQKKSSSKKKPPIYVVIPAVLVGCVVLFLAITLFSGNNSSPKTLEAMPAPLDTYSIVLNGTTITLPTTFEALKEIGFEPSYVPELENELKPYVRKQSPIIMINEFGCFDALVENPTGSIKKLKDCIIYELYFNTAYFNKNYRNATGNTLSLPNDLVFETSTLKDFKKNYSGYTKNDSSYEYRVDDLHFYQFSFYNDNILSSVRIVNGIPRGEYEDTYATAAPNYDSDKLANLASIDFELHIGDIVMTVPCPLNQYLNDGWTLEDGPEYIVSQEHNTCYLRKDLRTTWKQEVENPFRDAMAVDQCFVCNLSLSNISYEKGTYDFSLIGTGAFSDIVFSEDMDKETVEKMITDANLAMDSSSGEIVLYPYGKEDERKICLFFNSEGNLYSFSFVTNNAVPNFFKDVK